MRTEMLTGVGNPAAVSDLLVDNQSCFPYAYHNLPFPTLVSLKGTLTS